MDARNVTGPTQKKNSPASFEDELQPEQESRIFIRPDGEVVIENLSAALAEVALELDPESEIACRLPNTQTASDRLEDKADPS